MDKRIIMIILGIFLIGGAIAFTIGETINQNQFNEINFNEMDFNMNITNTYIENDMLFIEFEYNSWEKQFNENGIDTNQFVLTTKTDRMPYYLGYYRDCRVDNNADVCNAKIYEFIYGYAEEYRNVEKAGLEELKTKELINDLEITNFKDLYINFDLYKTNKAYSIGDIFVFENELYEVIQAHTSQANWVPSQLPALYKVKVLQEFGEIREWVQPISSVDCYALGDKVTYNGFTWENTGSSCNIWAPGIFGWSKVI